MQLEYLCDFACPAYLHHMEYSKWTKLGQLGGLFHTRSWASQLFGIFFHWAQDRKLNAKGYVRFTSHRHAENCIQAQALEP